MTIIGIKKNIQGFSIRHIGKGFEIVFFPIVIISLLYIPFFISADGQLIVNHDITFFGHISYHISNLGIENRNGVFNSLAEFSEIRHLYHYADLWLVALLTRINDVHVFYLIFMCGPVISISVVYYYIRECYIKLELFQKIILLFLLLSTFVCIPLMRNHDFFNSTFHLGKQSFWSFPKYFFLVSVFLFYIKLRKLNKTYAELILIVLPFAHTGTLPLVMILLICRIAMYIYEEWNEIKRNCELGIHSYKQQVFHIISQDKFRHLCIIFASCLIVSTSLFYYYFESDEYTLSVFNLSRLFSLSYFKLILVMGAQTLLDSFIVISPFILFILWNRKHINKETVIGQKTVLAFMFSGFLCFMLFNYTSNEAYQFYYYVFFSIFPVFLISNIFSICVSYKNKIQFIGIALFVFYGFYSFYYSQILLSNGYVKTEFIQKLKSNFTEKVMINKPGAIFYNAEFNNPRNLRGMQDEYPVLGLVHPSLYFSRFSPLPDLSNLSLNTINDVNKFDAGTNAYSVYCKKNNIKKDYSKASILRAFEYLNICWLIETPNSYIPRYIDPIIDTTIIDDKRNTKIHFLKKWRR
ncbi:hypothetical protein N9335_02255 [Crocinitomicaceae bacterium]|nr:hypothetical protein [Crocinitomicaceae bacterium]